MKHLFLRTALLLAAAAFPAQQPTGVLNGRVLTSMQEPVGGAVVVLHGVGFSYIRVVNANTDGQFATAVEPGLYKVCVEASGFDRPCRILSMEAGRTTHYEPILKPNGALLGPHPDSVVLGPAPELGFSLRPLPIFLADVLPPPMPKNSAPVPEGFHYPELGRSVLAAGPIIATRLAGRAVDELGHPVERALIELMTPHWRKRISARFTDEAGRFDFGVTKRGQYLLKITYPGFAPLLAKVAISKTGPPAVTLTLYAGT